MHARRSFASISSSNDAKTSEFHSWSPVRANHLPGIVDQADMIGGLSRRLETNAETR
ncbi:hypothetical protein SS05631_c06360 [Sinorhizobium sp. CCBAU 05631]|uniref:Uncharacterized protein n=1 Tax=Rhizobium fredii TaxID=380 RepID=A0A2L0H273_RHIFR|nr:hypothetical protein SS05631_c06360 [Sinorhizobium sp. CCBAU 05631]AUX75527.1 hypothetical protein NXT3_CH00930 [Sinorhizobium fredii]